MQQRWKDVEPIIRSTLGDDDEVTENVSREYDQEKLIMWWNLAQQRLATIFPKQSHQVYKADDGLTPRLPDWHYKPKSVFAAGISTQLDRLYVHDAMLHPETVGYYIYENQIVLSGFRTPPVEWLYLYHSYFPQVENEKSIIHPPLWSWEALSYYVGTQAMALEAVGDARYRQYTAPPDATGNPTHNPYLEVAKYYEKRFFDIVNAHVDDDFDHRI